MTSIGSFWRLVVLPTLGFGAMLGFSEAGRLTGLPQSSLEQAAPDLISSTLASWDDSSVEWRDWLPKLEEAPQPAPRARIQAVPNHRDVQWPMR